jgi:hypothetical protein
MNKMLDLFDIFKIKYSPVTVLKKYSRLGLASFFMAMTVAGIVIGDLAIILRMQNTPLVVQNFTVIDPLLTCLVAILTMAGLVLGFVAVVQRQKNRLFGFVGLIFNGLFLVGIFSLYAINVVAMVKGTGG